MNKKKAEGRRSRRRSRRSRGGMRITRRRRIVPPLSRFHDLRYKIKSVRAMRMTTRKIEEKKYRTTLLVCTVIECIV